MLKLKNLYFLKVLNLKLLFQITTKLKRISPKFKILKVKLLVKVVQVVPLGPGETVSTDITALATAITKAKAVTQVAVSTDGSDVLPTAKWTTQEELNAFKQAITAAEAVLNKAGVTQAEVNQAVLDLENAVTTYTNAQKAGTNIVSGEVDRTALSTKIADAQAVKVAVSDKWI